MRSSSLKNKDKKLPLILFLSFLICAAVMVAVYIINGTDPFGSVSILTSDLKIQYKDYYGYLWDVLHGNASLEYSASKSLGGQMIGLVVYYLTCPLNLLIYFIDKSQIPLFVSIITVVKIAFAGLTASYFIRKRFNISLIPTVLIACCYALSEYSFVYCHNIMWLDGVVMLPLACLGVYELLYNNKKGLLFFSVFMAIFSNWYAGYMVCLMTGFCFLFELAQKYDFRDFKNVIKPAIGDALRVAADMILGVLASGIILVPGLLSLLGGKASSGGISFKINVRLLESLKGFMINADSNATDATIMYCGAIVLVLTVYMFVDKRISLKKRILSLTAFAFMIFCFCIDVLNVMWTGFVKSYSYQFRWAFTFIFLMAYFACVCVKEIKKHGFCKLTMLKALGIITGVFILLDLAGATEKSMISYFYIALVVVYGAALVLIHALKNKKFLRYTAALLVCALTLAELTANGALVFKQNYKDDTQDYIDYSNEMSAAVSDIKAADDSFYRIEKTVSYLTEVGRENMSSEGFMFNYNGIAGYTSTYDPNVDIFLAKMGYSDPTSINEENYTQKKYNATETYYNSPLFVADSFLGIKYQILSETAPGLEKFNNNDYFDGRYSIYENPYALPLAFNVSEKLYDDLDYGNDPFENQEKLISAALGYDVALYTQPDFTKGSMKDKKQDMTVTVEKDGPLYFYTDPADYHDSSNGKQCALYLNGERVQRICSRFYTNAVYLGDFSAGEKVDVSIHYISDKSSSIKTHDVYFAQLDVAATENALTALASGSSSTLNFSKNTVSGEYHTDTDSTVILTVPYTEGWTLYVDGQAYDYKEIADTFIGIDLTAGDHQIEMRYSTLHKNAGIAASVVGFAGFAAWCVLDVLRKKKGQLTESAR